MDLKIKNWCAADYLKFVDYLNSIADESYRSFNEKIIPCDHPILGIRMPELRKLAKELAKGDWKSYLKAAKDDSHEEIMLQGIVIAVVSSSIEFCEVMRYIMYYVPKMSNWALVDAFCSDLKIINKYQEEAFFFIVHYLKSKEEYQVRFAVVMLMNYYLDETHIKTVFGLFDGVKHDGYYAKMAVAWAISIAFIKMEDQTMDYFNHHKLNHWTYLKALQKIVESNRVNQEKKDRIRTMKQQAQYE